MSEMLICNTADANINLRGANSPIIDYVFYTDLPLHTQVIITCQRTYLDSSGSISLWVGHSERLALTPKVKDDYCGIRGSVDVVSSDKKAFELFKQINSTFPPGISTAVGDVLTIIFTIGGRQRSKEYGRNNSYLSGKMVTESGGINIVEIQRDLLIPMELSLQPHVVVKQ